ncbi:MAG: glutamine--fructose-6-phosphate transaminase (isomerizing) [Pseudomonadota bacterium]
MCGIVGLLSDGPAASRIVEALTRLEYRGYDSAGIALVEDGVISRQRRPGKIIALRETLDADPISGSAGVGHTRWATHGAPTETNAHPHATARVAVAHNGIIENFQSLKDSVIAQGADYASETDSEVIAHLIDLKLQSGRSPEDAVRATLSELEGAYAIACVFADDDDLMIAARKGSPLAVGIGPKEAYIGSDAIALSGFTEEITFLEDGDMAILNRGALRLTDVSGAAVTRPTLVLAQRDVAVSKGSHRHFMHKEICEQPDAVERTLHQIIDIHRKKIVLPDLDGVDIAAANALLIACGTAHYAGRIAEYWLEQYARVAVETDIASEFRYRQPVVQPDAFSVFVSQSGETADTIAAMRFAREGGYRTLGVVNVPQSTIWREADARLPTLAGPEIGVASTKAFTAQLCVLACLAVAMGRARGVLSEKDEKKLVNALLNTPALIAKALDTEPDIEKIATTVAGARQAIYIGRGPHYPLALEGALKLKEITYIHAEACAAGELKHGPIALIDETTPVVAVAPYDALFDKTFSNMQEVSARGGKIILITDKKGAKASGDLATHCIEMPECDPFTAPILYAVPLQLLAYLTAVRKGTDVDQPRNLAKSVTVE